MSFDTPKKLTGTLVTTAGFIPYGICTEQRRYLVQILQGEVDNDAYFGVIFTLDEGDDWRKEATWKKANPSLGTAKSLAYMRSEARSAAEVPSQLNNFLTKELNVWVNQAQAWFDIFVWDKGAKPIDVTALHGRECYGGLDLADTTDLAAFELVFPPVEGDPDWYLLSWVFCPEENIETRTKRDKVQYPDWVKSGHLIATPGNVTDYERIRQQHAGKKQQVLWPLAKARANATPIDWTAYVPPRPHFIGRREFRHVDLATLRPYIDWGPFFQTWDLAGPYPAILTDEVVGEAATALYADAREMLEGTPDSRLFVAGNGFMGELGHDARVEAVRPFSLRT